jgi:hypothetical protein
MLRWNRSGELSSTLYAAATGVTLFAGGGLIVSTRRSSAGGRITSVDAEFARDGDLIPVSELDTDDFVVRSELAGDSDLVDKSSRGRGSGLVATSDGGCDSVLKGTTVRGFVVAVVVADGASLGFSASQ